MASKAIWDILLSAAEAATRIVDGESAVAVDAVVEAQLPRYPQLTSADVKVVRHASFDLARFAALCDGAFQGYCNCFKRNSSNRAAMYLVAYLFIFQFRALGEDTVRELIAGCMPHPRLCEYVQFLFSPNLLTQFSVPLWRTTYDDRFIQEQVMAPLSAAAVCAAGDVEGWLPRRIGGANGPPPDAQPETTATLAAASVPGASLASTPPPVAPPATAAAPAAASRDATKKKEVHPPELHTSTRPRLPPREVREMALTVPEPRLPRIKDAPLPARPHATKPPTKPMGFSFHSRDAARATASPRDAAGARTSSAVGASSSLSAPPGAAASASASSSTNGGAQDNGTATMAAARADRSAESSPRPSSSQLRRMLNRSAAVPTTNAALRREACMRDRQRAHAEKALTELEVVARDATEYEMWRQAQEETEERARETEVMQRHLDAIETEERVRAQRAHAADVRRRKFKTLRAKYQEELQSRKVEQEAELQRQNEAVQQQRTQQQMDKSAALDKSSAVKATLAAEVKQESEELRAAAQEAEEQRQTQQALLIQEIHIMRQRIREKQARLGEERRLAWADGEEDAALGRMSVAELRAALERVRAEAEAEVAERHSHVAEVRTRVQLERERLEAECAAARARERQKREVKLTQRAQHKAAVEDERAKRETARMLQLHEKLETKRQAAREAQRVTREAERQRRNELLLRAQDSTSMEQGRWGQYEAGLVRRSKWEQQRALQEAQK